MLLSVQVGDTIQVVVANKTTSALVESSATTMHKGYYGLWTMTGSIVVDGVEATAHAAWGIDPMLDLLPGEGT